MSQGANETVLMRMKQQMGAQQAPQGAMPDPHTQDEPLEEEEEEAVEAEALTNLVDLLETITPTQLKIKAMSRTVVQQMQEVTAGRFYGEIVNEIASHFTWDGRRFKVMSVDVLRSLASEMRLYFYQQDNQHDGQPGGHDADSNEMNSEDEEAEAEGNIPGLPVQSQKGGDPLESYGASLHTVQDTLSAIQKGGGELAALGDQLRLVEQEVSSIRHAAGDMMLAEGDHRRRAEDAGGAPALGEPKAGGAEGGGGGDGLFAKGFLEKKKGGKAERKKTRFAEGPEDSGPPQQQQRPAAQGVVPQGVLKPESRCDPAGGLDSRMTSLLGMLAEDGGSHLQAVRRDLIASRREVDLPKPAEAGADSPYGIFGNDNKVIKRAQPKTLWEKFKANYKQYTVILLFVMVINVRGFFNMVNLLYQDPETTVMQHITSPAA